MAETQEGAMDETEERMGRSRGQHKRGMKGARGVMGARGGNG